MELYEKTLESRDIFNGRVLHIMVDKVELPNGHIAEREFREENTKDSEKRNRKGKIRT